jgi:hypothetical protein
MEKLTHLMQLIDANSGVLPEGVYLEMCNDMKEVHENMKEGWDPEHYSFDSERYTYLETELHNLVALMEKIKKRMKRYKLRKRMSAKMKKEAIMEWSDHMRLDSLREYTEEALLESTNLASVDVVYKWYLDIYNERVEFAKTSAIDALVGLSVERDLLIEDLALEMRRE